MLPVHRSYVRGKDPRNERMEFQNQRGRSCYGYEPVAPFNDSRTELVARNSSASVTVVTTTTGASLLDAVSSDSVTRANSSGSNRHHNDASHERADAKAQDDQYKCFREHDCLTNPDGDELVIDFGGLKEAL